MTGMMGRLADRVLSRVVPKSTAEAGCNYTYYICYCSGGLMYKKPCMNGCPGVANHCKACGVTGTC